MKIKAGRWYRVQGGGFVIITSNLTDVHGQVSGAYFNRYGDYGFCQSWSLDGTYRFTTTGDRDIIEDLGVYQPTFEQTQDSTPESEPERSLKRPPESEESRPRIHLQLHGSARVEKSRESDTWIVSDRSGDVLCRVRIPPTCRWEVTSQN